MYSQNGALKPALHDDASNIPLFELNILPPFFDAPPFRAMFIWCAETSAERDAAEDCLAVSNREVGP